MSQKQSGYGFIHFPRDHDGICAAVNAARALTDVTIDEVNIKCSLSHKLNRYITGELGGMNFDMSASAPASGETEVQVLSIEVPQGVSADSVITPTSTRTTHSTPLPPSPVRQHPSSHSSVSHATHLQQSTAVYSRSYHPSNYSYQTQPSMQHMVVDSQPEYHRQMATDMARMSLAAPYLAQQPPPQQQQQQQAQVHYGHTPSTMVYLDPNTVTSAPPPPPPPPPPHVAISPATQYVQVPLQPVYMPPAQAGGSPQVMYSTAPSGQPGVPPWIPSPATASRSLSISSDSYPADVTYMVNSILSPSTPYYPGSVGSSPALVYSTPGLYSPHVYLQTTDGSPLYPMTQMPSGQRRAVAQVMGGRREGPRTRSAFARRNLVASEGVPPQHHDGRSRTTSRSDVHNINASASNHPSDPSPSAGDA